MDVPNPQAQRHAAGAHRGAARGWGAPGLIVRSSPEPELSCSRSGLRLPDVAARFNCLLPWAKGLATLAVMLVAVVMVLVPPLLRHGAVDPRRTGARAGRRAWRRQVSGQITELRVADNQFVHKGDVLYVIDPFDFEVALRIEQGDTWSRRRPTCRSSSCSPSDGSICHHRDQRGGAAGLCRYGRPGQGRLRCGPATGRPGRRSTCDAPRSTVR